MGKLLTALWSFVIRYVVVLFYIVIGAAIFMHVENKGVQQNRGIVEVEINAAKNVKESLRKKLSKDLNVTVNSTLFDELVKEIHKIVPRTKPEKWTLVSGAHFAFTIVSTIGYGVIVPTIDETRILTIFYAIVGIPLFLYAMAAAGELKKELCLKILQAIEIGQLNRRRISRKHEKVIGVTLIFFIVELLLASAMVYEKEKWPFFIAFYFWFVTASTIGFGDYVLSFEGNNQVSAAMSVLVILLSLVLMSDLGSIFSTISEMLVERSKEKRESFKNCFCVQSGKHDINEENGKTIENVTVKDMVQVGKS